MVGRSYAVVGPGDKPGGWGSLELRLPRGGRPSEGWAGKEVLHRSLQVMGLSSWVLEAEAGDGTGVWAGAG